jgi:hypothetical protein
MVHQITISWNASPAPVSGYNIRRGTAVGNESPTPLNATPILGTSFTDNTVYAGQIYSYEITAVYNGVESAESLGIITPAVPFDPSPALLDFGSASSFAVLGATTVTNVPGSGTVISGDVGVSPGSALTGFSSPATIAGVFHQADFVAAAAQTAALAVFNAGMSLPDGYTLLGDIGGEMLLPGVYKSASSVGITGSVVLNAQSNPNAVWIFQIGSTLTTASSNSSVILTGGAQADHVFWLVGSSATLNTNTAFAGNVIAMSSVTVGANVNMNGRLVALTGAVTLNDDQIVLFLTGTLAIWAPSAPFGLGQVIFDGASYQEVTMAGTSGPALPGWNRSAGLTTTDGSVVWSPILAVGDIVILTDLPPSLPNVPPPPPAPPSGVRISSEN